MSSFTFSMISSLSIATFVMIFALILTIVFIRKQRQITHDSNPSTSTVKATQISAIVTFVNIIFCASSIVVLMSSQLWSGELYTNKHPIYIACRVSFFVLFMLWYISSYIFMLTRLIVTFKDSVYAISKRVIYMHIVIMAVFAISTFTIYAFIFIRNMGQLLLSLVIFLFAAGLVHLAYAFNCRLLRLVITQRRTVIGDADQSLSETQKSILTVIRKNTLLTSIQIVSILSSIASYSIAVSVGNEEHVYWPLNTYRSTDAYYLAFDVVKAGVFVVSSLCVYLGFKVNEAGYVALCRHCDAKCQTLFEGIVGRRMDKEKVTDAQIVVETLSASPSRSKEDSV